MTTRKRLALFMVELEGILCIISSHAQSLAFARARHYRTHGYAMRLQFLQT
jgi:hypothetical protein